MKILKILLLLALPITAISAPSTQVSEANNNATEQQNNQECKIIKTVITSGDSQEAENRVLCLKNGKYELVDKETLETNEGQPVNTDNSSIEQTPFSEPPAFK